MFSLMCWKVDDIFNFALLASILALPATALPPDVRRGSAPPSRYLIDWAVPLVWAWAQSVGGGARTRGTALSGFGAERPG